ncbi:DUF4199 domain-containing protein [Mesonia aestuariivivens]|uniref:DUF4199 domain-containing protein n=1 Tax=Mesonia aestuariivivens TaxID=2796128 RepID=A0ABS6W137_9FLAO|nr:DUF4199 domain-containing protein [Mesonia aestuariivivens]MBW2961459.1 DUF4199 domain-containing protein [Mesonia aestuariivivens]
MNNQVIPNLKKLAGKYGIVLGIVLALMTIVSYFFYLELFTKWWTRILTFVIILSIAIIGSYQCKKASSEIYTYKKAFTSYFIIILIGLLIYTATNYLIFNILDPNAADFVLAKTIEMTKSFMENFGASQEDINNSIKTLTQENQFSLKNQILGLCSNLVIYILIGLLVSLGLKENKQITE